MLSEHKGRARVYECCALYEHLILARSRMSGLDEKIACSGSGTDSITCSSESSLG